MTTPTGDAGVTRTESLEALLGRVRAATGPDRVLDVRILAGVVEPSEWSGDDIEYACSAPERTCKPPYYTDSVDAALALMERVLPGWDVHLYHDAGQYVAEMTWPDGTDVGEADYFGITGRAPTRPLAILFGIVDGLIEVARAQQKTQALIARSEETDHAE